MRNTMFVILTAALLTAPLAQAGPSCDSAKGEKKMTACVYKLETEDFEKAEAEMKKIFGENEAIASVDFHPEGSFAVVSYNKEKIKCAKLDEAVKSAESFKATKPELYTTKVTVKGMSCMGCVNKVKSKLSKLEGVAVVDVELESGKVEVLSLKEGLTKDDIQKPLKKYGYKVS